MGAGHFQEFEDEYLEALYEFDERNPGKLVRNGELAKYLGVTPASATEMVQRLAKNGFVEYTPYKGVSLTKKGLEHGKLMKRRHRLAEVLLSRLPFNGDIHETACRLEHAFNDDLEACISLMLGDPKLDPSGRDIPPANNAVKQKLQSTSEFVLASKLENGQQGVIELILVNESDLQTLEDFELKVNSIVERDENGKLIIAGTTEMSENMSNRVLLRWKNE